MTNNMRLGLVARSDNSGLGMQTWEFYRHMQPDKTMVVDISKFNNNQTFPERYGTEGVMHITGFPTNEEVDYFLQDLDVVFVAEAPYNFYLYERAKQLGVKVAVQYNYEFFDWFVHPDWPMPDMLVAPSRWHYDEIDAFCKDRGIEHVYLHCPINREVIKPREIKQARTFLHVAGRAASHDRNGTKTVIWASAFLETDAKIEVHFQGEQGLAHQTTMTTADYEVYADNVANKQKLTIIKKDYENYWDNYANGDVLLLPRRYGGNCLPMNEALGIGMPVIMTDIDPNNKFLIRDWLIPARKVAEFEPRTVIDIYEATPVDLARKIDQFYLLDEFQFKLQHTVAKEMGTNISWPSMIGAYRRALEGLCTPR